MSWGWTPFGPIATASSGTRKLTPGTTRAFARRTSADLILYQFHIGTYYATAADGSDCRATRGGTFLDVLSSSNTSSTSASTRLQPLPVVEFESDTSMGYNGVDIFSPEYALRDRRPRTRPLPPPRQRPAAREGQADLTLEQLERQVNQLKAFIDVCHLYGLAVILDVVYNHAGAGAPGGTRV